MKIKKSYLVAVVSSLMVLATGIFISSTAYAQTNQLNQLSEKRIAVLQQKALTHLADSILKIQEMPIAEENIRHIEQFLPENVTGIITQIIAISKSNAPIEKKVDTIIKTYDSSCYDYVIASIVADALYYFLCVRAPGGCGPFAYLDEISYVTWALAVLCYYGIL